MISIDPGELDKRIQIERKSVESDAYGGEVETWAPLCRPWAKVLYGTGAERRAAAQIAATQSATFRVRANSVTNAVAATDRIAFDGGSWDIASNVPFGRDGRDITAIRKD